MGGDFGKGRLEKSIVPIVQHQAFIERGQGHGRIGDGLADQVQDVGRRLVAPCLRVIVFADAQALIDQDHNRGRHRQGRYLYRVRAGGNGRGQVNGFGGYDQRFSGRLGRAIGYRQIANFGGRGLAGNGKKDGHRRP